MGAVGEVCCIGEFGYLSYSMHGGYLYALEPLYLELSDRSRKSHTRVLPATKNVNGSHYARFSAKCVDTFSKLPQGSPEWLQARSLFWTSSRFGLMAGKLPRKWDTPERYWREVTGRDPVKPFSEFALRCMAHGTRYEPEARDAYQRLMGYSRIVEEGLRCITRAPYIYAASADGLIEGRPHECGIVEIKCKAVGPPRTHVPDYYICQMMGAMRSYDAPFCDFVDYWRRVGEPPKISVTRVHWSMNYWRMLRIRLDYFSWCVENDYPLRSHALMALTTMFPLPLVHLEIRIPLRTL